MKIILPILMLLSSVVFSADKPNFIIILTDDQGYQDLGCFGSPLIKTPHIDRMASEGMRFTDFYAQPICGPSRAAMMTGSYPLRIAEVGNIKREHPMVHPEEIMLPELLKQAGYVTGCIGKWDMNGHKKRFERDNIYPGDFGFDYWFGTAASNDFGVIDLWRDRTIIEEKVRMDRTVQEYHAEAIQFIERNKERPFFLYLAHTMPHIQLGASADFKGKSERGLYGDTIEEIDWSAGEIVRTLELHGLAENTVVVFCSDNGPWLVKQENGGSALPLRDGKTTTWEGGMRVPCVIWGPGIIEAGKTCSELTSTLDLLPTFCELADAPLPTDRVIDGDSLVPLLSGEGAKFDADRTYYYYFLTHLQAVRHGNWKLVLKRPRAPEWLGRLGQEISWKGHATLRIPEHQLYDLNADISESKDVSADHPEVVQELLEIAELAREDIGDYNRIGANARFFESNPKRPESKQWMD